MSKELEEILDRWKLYISLTKDFSNKDMELIKIEELEELLDYITNLQQENKQLKEELENIKDFNNKLQASKDRLDKDDYNLAHILTELEEWLKEKWYEIEPKGTGINFNCEYDSEEDYVRGMETKSKLDTLKNSLNKIQELKEKYK